MNVSISLVHNFEREDVSLSCRYGPPGIVVVPAVGLAREQTDQKRTLSGVDRCRVRRETGGVVYKLLCDTALGDTVPAGIDISPRCQRGYRFTAA